MFRTACVIAVEAGVWACERACRRHRVQHLAVKAQESAGHGGYSTQNGSTTGQLRPQYSGCPQLGLDLDVGDQHGRREAQLATLAGAALVDVSVRTDWSPALATPVLDLVAHLAQLVQQTLDEVLRRCMSAAGAAVAAKCADICEALACGGRESIVVYNHTSRNHKLGTPSARRGSTRSAARPASRAELVRGGKTRKSTALCS